MCYSSPDLETGLPTALVNWLRLPVPEPNISQKGPNLDITIEIIDPNRDINVSTPRKSPRFASRHISGNGRLDRPCRFQDKNAQTAIAATQTIYIAVSV